MSTSVLAGTVSTPVPSKKQVTRGDEYTVSWSTSGYARTRHKTQLYMSTDFGKNWNPYGPPFYFSSGSGFFTTAGYSSEAGTIQYKALVWRYIDGEWMKVDESDIATVYVRGKTYKLSGNSFTLINTATTGNGKAGFKIPSGSSNAIITVHAYTGMWGEYGSALVEFRATFTSNDTDDYTISAAQWLFEGVIKRTSGSYVVKLEIAYYVSCDGKSDSKTYKYTSGTWDTEAVQHKNTGIQIRLKSGSTVQVTVIVNAVAYKVGFWPGHGYVDFYYDAKDLMFESITLSPA